jgi:hypothetical protein
MHVFPDRSIKPNGWADRRRPRARARAETSTRADDGDQPLDLLRVPF